METSKVDRNDCDFVALNKDHAAFTGTAHIQEVAIKTNILPDELTFAKENIAYIHFKQLPYQPNDFIQLTTGASVEGEIINMDKIEFTIADNGQQITFLRDLLLAIMFRCSIDAIVAKK